MTLELEPKTYEERKHARLSVFYYLGGVATHAFSQSHKAFAALKAFLQVAWRQLNLSTHKVSAAGGEGSLRILRIMCLFRSAQLP